MHVDAQKEKKKSWIHISLVTKTPDKLEVTTTSGTYGTWVIYKTTG